MSSLKSNYLMISSTVHQ